MTTSPTRAAVDALAAYRLVRLLQRDRLPPLPAIRASLTDAAGDRAWAELLDCAWCAGVHAAALAALGRRFVPWLWGPIAGVLAGSAAVGLLTAVEDALSEAGIRDVEWSSADPELRSAHRTLSGERVLVPEL